MLLGAGVVITAAGPAAPWTGALTWTAYLHEGPGRQYRVEDEIDTATNVEVLACSDGWCRVAYGGAIGYLPRDVLKPATEPAPSNPAPPADCFDARRAGAGAGKVFSYCPK